MASEINNNRQAGDADEGSVWCMGSEGAGRGSRKGVQAGLMVEQTLSRRETSVVKYLFVPQRRKLESLKGLGD